ncbi:MAG TPA: toll/interleukin-1 receptor domain-containing protein [Thermoanaerobaculaceae bacterium]|nr:toll/interleukin-1 receptor domain-containing protein [Thermoanaerobaculaceae bacterium]
MTRMTRVFASYASADEDLACRLLELLEEHLRASRRGYGMWEFRRLLVGERWHERIQEEIAACDVGLLLLSPAFLASEYIARHELPHFVEGEGKPIVPVGLKLVDLARHDHKGLADYQVFRLDGRSFSQLRTPGRERFVLDLFRQIEARVDQCQTA